MRHLPRFSCILAPWPGIGRVMVFLLLLGLMLLGPSGFSQPVHGPGQTAPIEVAASVLSDYQIQSYRIDCEITPDGLIRVQEKLDIVYEQDCEELAFVLDAGKARTLELLSVAISTRSENAGSEDQLVEVMPAEADSQAQMQSMSYKLSSDDALKRLKIRTIGEVGEARQVVVRYQLDGALVQLTDAILFRRGFFTLAPNKSVANPILLIHCPAGSEAGSLWFTAISPVPFVSAEVDQDTIQMSAPQLPARQGMTAALILPVAGFANGAALLPQGVVQDTSASIAEIETEQARMTQRAFVKGFLARLNWILMLVALFVLTFLVLVFEREGLLSLPRHAREDKNPLHGPDYSPAILARLSRHHHPGQILLGTLMDLVLRGKLRLDGHVFTLKAHGLPDYQGMSAFEIFLLQWFFERITQENTLSTAQIRRYALDSKTATEFSAYYEQFIHLIQEDMVKAGLLDLHKKHLGQVIGLTLAAGYALASVMIATVTGTLAGLILLLPALLFGAFAFGLKHLTRLGHIEAAKAGFFRQTLRHYARVKKSQPDNPALDCALLAPAVALGVARIYLRQLKTLYGSKRGLISQFMAPLTKSLAGDAQNLADFARDLDAMGSMLSASLYLALGIHFYD
ncbi:MAG: DUF2207 domain-containing protein [Eubacteriales bacterium]|nr:DUF2207 domain-containing protein [Eubacteriales bacterium]